MGKRRKPSRKTNYQSLESIKADRMAGNVNQIIDQLISDPKLIQESKASFDPMSGSKDARREVLNERQRLNKELAAAGLNMQGVGGLHRPIDVLGAYLVPGAKTLQPGTINQQLDNGIERRVLTEARKNSITGENEIEVVRKKDGSDFIVDYGVSAKDANELIDALILERMGYDVTPNPQGWRRGEPDFHIEGWGRDGRRGVDSITAPTNSSDSGAHLYTNILPNRPDPGKTSKQTLMDDINNRPSEMSVIDAINSFGDKYWTRPSHPNAGKIIQADPSTPANARYDSLLQSAYPYDVWRNPDKSQRPGEITTPPSSLKRIDLAVALEAVRRNMQERTDVIGSRGKPGGKGSVHERFKVIPFLDYATEVDGVPMTTDLVARAPQLGQFLDRNALEWVIPPA